MSNDPGFQPQPPQQPQQSLVAQQSMTPDVISAGKTWAMISYASFFAGLPLFIVPFIQKDNAYALYHARQAAASYILGVVAAVLLSILAVVTCGFGAVLIPLALFPLITAVHGLILVNSGEVREPILVFGLGDKLFGSFR